MKYLKKYKSVFLLALVGLFFTSCSDELEMIVPYPTDITFNDIQVDRFSFEIPDAPFEAGNAESGVITVNTVNTGGGTFSGFSISNKNWRSYPWSLSPDFEPSGGVSIADRQKAIDSTIFSVYTNTPNRTENYLVANTEGDNAYFTLKVPSIVEHVLVANTSYNYLLARYGSIYSRTLDTDTGGFDIEGTKVRNIKIDNRSTTMYGRFLLPGPNNSNLLSLSNYERVEKIKAGTIAADAARLNGLTSDQVKIDSTAAANAINVGFTKLTIDGFNNGNKTASVEYYLSVRPNVDPANPEHDVILGDWYKVDLTSLGEVDKVLFKMSSSYAEKTNTMFYPPYFCLDGVRLMK